MSLLTRPLHSISAAQLDELVVNDVREGREIDYKETAIGGTDDDKREFLADVASFANAGGGDLVIGIKERRDANNKPTGEAEAVVGLPDVNRDAEVLRLLSLIRDGIAPRVPSVQPRWIDRPAGDACLILRIPRSWVGPHMVTFKNLSRFYSRHVNGKYQLDVGEIRHAFLGGETRRQQLRVFRAERIARIIADEAPVPVGSGPKAILHALPLPATDFGTKLLALADSDVAMRVSPRPGSAANWHRNLDGCVVRGPENPNGESYVLVLRDGSLEACTPRVARVVPDQPDEGDMAMFREGEGPGLLGFAIERWAIHTLTDWLKVWIDTEESGPMLLGLTLTGARDLRLFPHSRLASARPWKIDRDPLVIPEVEVDNFAPPPDVILKPMLDMLWNAGGFAASPHFKSGRWTDH